MVTNNSDQLQSSQILNASTVLLLAGISWVSHFWYVSTFGLYEDDYTFVGQPISTDLNGLIELVKGIWVQFVQGRPIGFSCAYILSFIGFNIAGMTGVYCCGYVIILVNTLLFYWLMWRLSRCLRFAAIGGLAFCLFPADTTATFLTHSLGLYICTTLFLLAIHAYLSDQFWLAYLLISASLISYETCFPLFLTAPLLKYRWNRQIVNKLTINSLLMGLMLGLVIIIRKLVSESRMAELNILSALATSIWHTLIGPIVSIGMYAYRPIYVLFNWQSDLFVFTPIAIGLIWIILKKTSSLKPSNDIGTISKFRISRSQLWIVSIIMLFLAYPLTIILQVGDIEGRASRVHLAAIIGGSMLFTLGVDRLLASAKTNLDRSWISLGLATVFSLLVGFGLIVQADYRLAWSKQQNLVAAIVKLCPDLVEGTSILIESKDIVNPKQIASYSWSMPLLLERIYVFPDRWQVIPRIYQINPQWQQQISNPDLLPLPKITEWLTFIPKQHLKMAETNNTIMLRISNDRWTRIDRLSLGNGINLNFKPINSQSKINFPTRPLYPYLIAPPAKM